jgi:hypothetical protein
MGSGNMLSPAETNFGGGMKVCNLFNGREVVDLGFTPWGTKGAHAINSQIHVCFSLR